jgi:hypothetical protein
MNFLGWIAGCFSDREKALSLYRRGMAKAKRRNHQGALCDYTSTLGIPGLPTDVKAMVLFNRALVFVASGERQKGIGDLDSVLAMDDLLPDVRTMAKIKLEKLNSRPVKKLGDR